MRQRGGKWALVVVGVSLSALAWSGTTVPGHSGPRVDKDGNGIPDVGVTVVGHFDSYYAYDADGNYYYDVGDGRVLASVDSPEELDAETLVSAR